MKKRFNLFFPACIIIILMIVTGCKREINNIAFQGGTPPELTASVQNTIPLSLATQNDKALTLNWKNPNYKFTTGVSSQDVNYTIEIDTVGSNFSNPLRKKIIVRKGLSYEFTQRELNTLLLSDIELVPDISHNIEIRVKSSMGTVEAGALYSNILVFSVTPYVDPSLLPPDLFITGSATVSGWTNAPPPTQKFTYVGSKTYEIIIPFLPGQEYKFLTVLGQWQPQYGSSDNGVGSPGTLQLNDGTTSDPPAITTPTVAGDYKITVNLSNNTFLVVKQ